MHNKAKEQCTHNYACTHAHANASLRAGGGRNWRALSSDRHAALSACVSCVCVCARSGKNNILGEHTDVDAHVPSVSFTNERPVMCETEMCSM